MKKIGFILKRKHPQAERLAIDLARRTVAAGAQVAFSEKLSFDKTAPKVKAKVMASRDALIAWADLLVVLGGDGTLLSVARCFRKRSVPILGVNLGSLGFLTEIRQSEAWEILEMLIACDSCPSELLRERAMLEVTVKRGKKKRFSMLAVNDAVLAKSTISRMIGLELKVGGKLVSSFRSDGLIVATPTGSTAYSLAAGGPVLEPSVPALVVTPICPHSLTHRPLVVPDSELIEIALQPSDRDSQVLLTLDGQEMIELHAEDLIEVRRFDRHTLSLVSAKNRDFFSVLREKLTFGLRSVQGN